jgi:putative nucleotidyltransferase with HDIG domain
MAWVLMGGLLLVGLLPLSLVSSRLISLNKESLKTQQQDNQLLLAHSLAQNLDSHLDGRAKELAIQARVIAAESAGWEEAEIVSLIEERSLLDGFMTPDVPMARYTHRSGSGHTIGDAVLGSDPEIQEELALAFARLMNTGHLGEVVMGDPVGEHGTGGPMIMLSTAVGREGRRVGVLSALVRLTPLAQRGLRTSAYSIFVLDRDGELITEGGKEWAHSPAAYAELDIVKEFQASGGSRVMPYTASDPAGGSTELLAAYAETDRGWGVFVQTREEEAYGEVELMKRNTRYHAGLAALGAVIFGLLMTSWISRPIRRLANSSLALADGDFHTRVTIRSRNELGELAETFNFMAGTLEAYIARLKHAAEENTQLFLGSIRALAAAIDAKDTYTRGHSERVRAYASHLAKELGLPAEEVRKVEVGALLHDVGKIAIEDHILNKPGALTPAEYEIMKTHPVRGAGIMAPIRQLEDVIPAMKHHHERWDGGGYPDGLRGESIPLWARLVTMADCWDAMTTNRPYQKAMSLEEGIKRVESLSGKIFDPRIVKAFVAGLRRGTYQEIFDAARRQVHATEERLKKAAADRATQDAARHNLDPDCLPPLAEMDIC